MKKLIRKVIKEEVHKGYEGLVDGETYYIYKVDQKL